MLDVYIRNTSSVINSGKLSCVFGLFIVSREHNRISAFKTIVFLLLQGLKLIHENSQKSQCPKKISNCCHPECKAGRKRFNVGAEITDKRGTRKEVRRNSEMT